jgi:hypothetical protein
VAVGPLAAPLLRAALPLSADSLALVTPVRAVPLYSEMLGNETFGRSNDDIYSGSMDGDFVIKEPVKHGHRATFI